MPEPITLKAAPFQLRGNLSEDQITALVGLISGANLIALPTDAKWENASGLNVSILPNGKGVLTLMFKQ
jgi:hypothetical protein